MSINRWRRVALVPSSSACIHESNVKNQISVASFEVATRCALAAPFDEE
jgi:hypothetical protein